MNLELQVNFRSYQDYQLDIVANDVLIYQYDASNNEPTDEKEIEWTICKALREEEPTDEIRAVLSDFWELKPIVDQYFKKDYIEQK